MSNYLTGRTRWWQTQEKMLIMSENFQGFQKLFKFTRKNLSRIVPAIPCGQFYRISAVVINHPIFQKFWAPKNPSAEGFQLISCLVNGPSSPFLSVNIGVPQGSIHGHLWYEMFTTDLPQTVLDTSNHDHWEQCGGLRLVSRTSWVAGASVSLATWLRLGHIC